MVELERLENVKSELSESVPSDILEAKEILTQKESIINQSLLEARRVKDTAEEEARIIKSAAMQEHAEKVDDTEIVRAAHGKAEKINQEAVQQAHEIVQDAQRAASRIVGDADKAAVIRREGADQYARETLFNLEERLASQLGQVRRGIDALGIEVEVKIPTEPVMAS